MIHNTRIKIQEDTFTVEWESFSDVLIPENRRIFDSAILDCPEDMIKKHGEGVILYECNRIEEEIAKEWKIERRIDI